MSRQPELRLINSQFYPSSGDRTVVAVVLILGLVVALVTVYVILGIIPADGDAKLDGLGQLLLTAWQKASWSNRLQLMASLVSVIAFSIYYLLGRNFRLALTDRGIAFTTGLPEWLSRWTDWQLRWDEIESITVGCPMRGTCTPQAVRLILKPHKGKKRLLNAPQWLVSVHQVEGRKARRLLRPDFLDVMRDYERSEVVLWLRNAGHLGKLDAGTLKQSTGFALEKHPATRAVLILLVVFAAYALVDVLFLRESYVDVAGIAWWYHLGGGLLAMLAVSAYLLRTRVPVAESLGLGFIGMIAVVFALYPGMLRINMWTDTGGLVWQEYQMRAGGQLVPKDNGLPVITRFRNDSFWERYASGKYYRIALRRGGMGFYQFDIESVKDDIRACYLAKECS